ncbi:MAG: hypothetical protein FWF29_05485, partial [Treponema sp.]|nr:hypothetical protein [Treponema sp.]
MPALTILAVISLALVCTACPSPIENNEDGMWNVTFKFHDGVTHDAKVSISDGMTLSRPAVELENNAGEFFQGWFTAETGGEAYDWSLPVTKNFVLHAQWREKTQNEGDYDSDLAYAATYTADGALYEAEDADLYKFQILTDPKYAFTGTGYAGIEFDAGATLTFTVEIAKGGLYDLHFMTFSPSDLWGNSSKFNLLFINGVSVPWP